MPDQYRTEAMKNALVSITVAMALTCSIGGCSKPQTETTPPEVQGSMPVLQVDQGTYLFSMYPEYTSEEKSKLKFDVRDSQHKAVKVTTLSATLIAQDGHRQKAAFREDPILGKYVAEIPLKHHEDYIVETQVQLPDSQAVFAPRFSFHCCDPIAPVLDGDEEKDGGSSK
jgi:hypothetical protein